MRSLRLSSRERCNELRVWIFQATPTLFEDGNAVWVGNEQVQPHFSQVDYRFVWEIGTSRNFEAAAFCWGFYMAQQWTVPNIDFMLIWKSCLLPKVHFFSWLLFHDCLPTNMFLFNRECLSVTDASCPFCVEVETAAHAIFFCSGSIRLWKQLFKLVGESMTMPSTAYAFWQLWRSHFMTRPRREFATSLWFYIASAIWKRRNKFVFEGVMSSDDPLFSSIYLYWFVFKCKKKPLDFLVSDVFNNPNLLLSCN